MGNGYLLDASNSDAENFILDLASGKKGKDELVVWVENHLVTVPPGPAMEESSE